MEHLQICKSVKLDLQENRQIACTRVLDESAKYHLSWDRFVRLKAAAEAISALSSAKLTILDAGGYDGALSLFLPNHRVDVIDSATTGGSVLAIPAEDCSYDLVAAIDVLEHIEPRKRALALAEFSRVAKQSVILNYPCQASKQAQDLAFQLTNNPLIEEHVKWELPDTEWVLAKLAEFGFSGGWREHTSIAIWLGQYVTLNLMPESAKKLDQYLVKESADEPFSTGLYHLITSRRCT